MTAIRIKTLIDSWHCVLWFKCQFPDFQYLFNVISNTNVHMNQLTFFCRVSLILFGCLVDVGLCSLFVGGLSLSLFAAVSSSDWLWSPCASAVASKRTCNWYRSNKSISISVLNEKMMIAMAFNPYWKFEITCCHSVHYVTQYVSYLYWRFQSVIFFKCLIPKVFCKNIF